MREIKFRGKRLDNGDWTYGWLVIEQNGTAWISKYFHKGEWEQVDPETVGQFTGLKDKNSVEIYEGDILHIEIHNWSRKNDVIASENECVEFRDGKFGFLWGYRREFKTVSCFCETTFEVIGNVHENSKLLVEK